MTNIANLLIDNSYPTYTSTRTQLWPLAAAFAAASPELRLTYYDVETISHLLDTHGVTTRGAAAVREYLNSRQ